MHLARVVTAIRAAGMWCIRRATQAVKQALAEGKPIPTELRDSEAELRRQITYDGSHEEQDPIDDEFAATLRGQRDPKICVTTSRDPSSRLKQFAKEVKLLLPSAQRLNRGNHRVTELVEVCRANAFSDVVVLHETRGEPDGLVVCHLPLGPTAYFTLSNTVLRHDIADRAPMSEALPHLVLHNFNRESSVGRRVSTILRCLFPTPRSDSKRVVTFANTDDNISFRHHVYTKTGREVELKEVGPRFEMALYQIRLGTLDQTEADDEWALRPFMNSSKRRRVL